jgi:hypothetical protein
MFMLFRNTTAIAACKSGACGVTVGGGRNDHGDIYLPIYNQFLSESRPHITNSRVARLPRSLRENSASGVAQSNLEVRHTARM